MQVEPLESRTLLASTPWGEELLRGDLVSAHVLPGGETLVVSEHGLTRLNEEGNVERGAGTFFQFEQVSVALGGEDVIWAVASSSDGKTHLLRFDSNLQVQADREMTADHIAALNDGRLAFVEGGQLQFLAANGDLETTSIDVSGFGVTDIAADGMNNVYVAGYEPAADPLYYNSDSVGILRKYDASGTLLWQRRYDVGRINRFVALDVDAAGNVWVAARLLPNGAEIVAGIDPPVYIRAIEYSPEGSLVATPIVDANSVGNVLLTNALDISTRDGRAVIGFFSLVPGMINQPPRSTSHLVGVEGDAIRWRSVRTEEIFGKAVLAPGNALLLLQGDGATWARDIREVLVRVDDYRQGDTFYVPGSKDDDAITAEMTGEKVIARRGDHRIVTYSGGLTNINARLLEGDDSLTAPVPFNITADGGRGNDTLLTGRGEDSLSGGDGNDVITSRGRSDTISGGEGNDTIRAGSGDDTLDGGSGDDVIYGEDEFADVPMADPGNANDRMSGGGGSDLMYGGPGGNIIYGDWGGAGTELSLGDTYNDTLVGGQHNDFMGGGEGDDLMYGNAGVDIMHGDSGTNQLYGGPGNDDLTGRGHHDTLRGGAGNDSVDVFSPDFSWDQVAYGGSGDDTITAGDDSTVFSGEGADVLRVSHRYVIRDLTTIDSFVRWPPVLA